MDRVITFIHDQQRVSGAGPYVFRQSGVIHVNGRQVLNTNDRRVLPPADELTQWGPMGKFPFISQMLEFWNPIEQKEFFLSWYKIFYESGYKLQPRSGHVLFIAGPPNVGKGFLSQGIVGTSVGGFAEAESFFMGTDDFSSDLFACPLWFMDDAMFTTANPSVRRFAEAVKKIVANRYFRSNEKFKVATTVSWQGRGIISCNRDATSVRVIPDLSGSIVDKIMLLRTTDAATVRFPTPHECECILRRELPYFNRWILQYIIPPQCRLDDERFGGVKPYHEKSLVLTAEQSSSTAGFADVLEVWKPVCREQIKQDFWVGSPVQLQQDLITMVNHSGSVLKRFDHTTIGSLLSALKNKGGHGIDSIETATGRKWRIELV
jgi:hypothetical protein